MHGLKREIEGRQRRANSVWGMQNWELVNRKYLSALYFRWQTIWDGRESNAQLIYLAAEANG